MSGNWLTSRGKQCGPSDLDLHCLSKRLQIFQQTTKAYNFFVIFALKIDKCEFSVYAFRIFMKYEGCPRKL